MRVVSDFLQKFKNLYKDRDTKTAVILDVINQTTKINLKREDLEIMGEKIKINCNPVIRNEIFMHKSEIEDGFKSNKIFLELI